ncbi:arylacetamide deacetylase, partial [Pseudohyphozyma bogoriensis]
ALWDKRFKKTYEQVQKRREHHLKKSISEETSRIKKRLKELRRKQDSPAPRHGQFLDAPETGSPEAIDGVEGIWNLHGERPPPSSIAARKDTMEARKLATFLNEHYARIHALHLWSDVQEASTPAGPPRKSSTENLTA